MSEKPKVADWKPGTLAATKRAIGEIDPEEAKRMSEVLGGEVMYEKDTEPDDAKKKKPRRGALDRTVIEKNKENDKKRDQEAQKRAQEAASGRLEPLLAVTGRDLKKMNKLMARSDYKIKRDPGPFGFIKRFFSKGDILNSEFTKVALKLVIDTLEKFDKKIVEMIALTPPAYTVFIESNPDARFVFLRIVRAWDLKVLDKVYDNITNKNAASIREVIPFVRAVYNNIFRIYYYGPEKVPELITEVYKDCEQIAETPKKKMLSVSKEAIRLWSMIQLDVVKKLYPLLLRMSSKTYEEYPEFFVIKKKEILAFLNLQKYDMMTPGMQNNKTPISFVASQAAAEDAPKQDALVANGLKLLERLFPEAGFLHLDDHPDLFPYFAPIYRFPDGFNIISNLNPLQVVAVLMWIIDDIFQGMRDIKFTASDSTSEKSDTITKVMDDWSNYRETIFNKLYLSKLNEFVSRLYSQDDFGDSQFSKKVRTELSWQINYHFLPYYSVERLTLEKPIDESDLPPLYNRTNFARRYLAAVVQNCEAKKASKGAVPYLDNPWEHYKFAVTNEVSKRLDVLLNAKKRGPDATATNSALLRYSLRLIAVLDWWINDKDSPAYDPVCKELFRHDDDGKPNFDVEVRKDQNKLFADACRAAYKKKQEAKG